MGTTPAYAWFYKYENFRAYAKLSLKMKSMESFINRRNPGDYLHHTHIKLFVSKAYLTHLHFSLFFSDLF